MKQGNENEEYVAAEIHTWVWSGFYGQDDVKEMMYDIMEDDVDEAAMFALIEREFASKAEQERDWPARTDCDKVDRVFDDLNAKMIVAIQNAGMTMSDGHDDVGEIHSQQPHGTYRGYCFYHGQDLARAVDNWGLMLAFGDMRDTPEGKAEVAAIILQTLAAHGFQAEWNGDVETRINVPNIHWQRRLR